MFPRYVQIILKSTGRFTDQVTIHPDGKWEEAKRPRPGNNAPKPFRSSDPDDSDDLIEITKSGDSIRMSAPRSSKDSGSAPPPPPSGPSGNMGGSSTPNGGSNTAKRPISAVIDLTSSGDEEDEPLARAPKRPMTVNGYGPPSNLPIYQAAPGGNPLPPRPL